MLKVGIFSIGLETYWEQFEGLKNRLETYHRKIAQRLSTMDVQLVDRGMVDTVEKAIETGNAFKKEDVSIVFLFISTYALYCITRGSKSSSTCHYS